MLEDIFRKNESSIIGITIILTIMLFIISKASIPGTWTIFNLLCIT